MTVPGGAGLLAVEYALLLCIIVGAYLLFFPGTLDVIWHGIIILFGNIGDVLTNCVISR